MKIVLTDIIFNNTIIWEECFLTSEIHPAVRNGTEWRHSLSPLIGIERPHVYRFIIKISEGHAKTAQT